MYKKIPQRECTWVEQKWSIFHYLLRQTDGVSRAGRFTPLANKRGIHPLHSRVGPRTNLDVLGNSKILLPLRG